MTLAGLDDTHTMDGMGMDGRDLVQLSGQRNGQMISVFVFFSIMDDTSITARYTIYTWTKTSAKLYLCLLKFYFSSSMTVIEIRSYLEK